MHRWDVEKALGSTTPIDPALATDGIDEFLDVFVRTRGKQTLASTLVIGTTHSDDEWTLSPAKKAGRIDITHGRQSIDGPVTEVTGNPEAVLLALWGRSSATDGDILVTGDVTAAASLITL